MISVRATEEEIQPYLSDEVCLAAVNGAKSCVIAGGYDATDLAEHALSRDGFETKGLHTSHAFHSSMMDEIVPSFEDHIRDCKLSAPEIPILSTVTVDWLRDEEATDPSYWANHLRRTVRFFDAISRVWEKEGHLFLEVGPGRTLATLTGQNPNRRKARPALGSMPHPTKMESSHLCMRRTLGELWCHGLTLDWGRIEERDLPGERIPLPTYPFQRKRFLIEPVPLRMGAEVGEVNGEGANDIGAAEEAELIENPLDTVDSLKHLIASLSGMDLDDLDETVTFLELGFDSLFLTQVGKEIQTTCGVKVTLRQLIDEYPSIRELAGLVDEKSGGAMPAARPKADKASNPPAVPMVSVGEPKKKERKSRQRSELTRQQQRHISELTLRYVSRTKTSRELTQKYRPYHADPRTPSGFNRAWKEMVYQIVTTRSKGSRLLDVDGNEYIDILNGFGPGFLGHSTEFLTEAIEDQLHRGYEVGPQCLLAMEAAELFSEVTGNDRTSFVCTGSEAVQAAIRLSRTVTGRDKVVIFARDYHGNFDEVLVRGVNANGDLKSFPSAPGIPTTSVDNIVVLPYGTDESLEVIRGMADQLAAVIVEPVQSRRPEFRPAHFIHEVREITAHSGSLFVFDEVVTGFRFGPRGAQGYYGIEADLCTYGKVIGGGMPLGVVSGKREFMDTFDGGMWEYGDDSFPEMPVTFFAGTFVRHPLAMASVRAMLQFFQQQPLHFWNQINAKGDKLAGTVHRFFQENSIPIEMPNCGSLMFVRASDEVPFSNLFFYHLREKGVFILEGFPSYLTASHTDEDVEYVIDAFKESAAEMQQGGFFDPDGSGLTVGAPLLSGPTPRIERDERPSEQNGETPESVAGDFLEAICVATTEPQREILVASYLDPRASCAFNESASLKFRGELDVAVLREAFDVLLARHDALRATFSEDGLKMIIHPKVAVSIETIDIRGRKGERSRILEEDASTPFDLVNGPLARPRLLRLEDNEFELIVSAHHVVCDGWSFNVIAEELSTLYNSIRSGEKPVLPLAKQYAEHSGEMLAFRRSERYGEQKKFWLDAYSELPPAIDLPLDRLHQAERSFGGATIEHRIGRDVYEAVKLAGAKKGSTLYGILLATYQILMHRLSGQDDLVVCIPSAGQNDGANTDSLVGHCVNFLPLRSRYSGDEYFDEFLGRSRGTLLAATDNRTFTYGELISSLDIERDPRRMPLLEVAFNVERMDYFGEWNELEVAFEPNGKTHVHYTFFMNIVESAEGLLINVDYNTDVLDESTVYRWVDYFENLLLEVIEGEASGAVSGMKLTPETGLRKSVESWNHHDVGGPFPARPVHHLFEEQVAVYPDSAALLFGDETISYRRLNAQADAIARELQGRGIGKGDFVAVLAHRSPEVVAGLFGVLKAGAAYVPIDPAYPEERIRTILDDAGAGLLLVSSGIDYSAVGGIEGISIPEIIASDSGEPFTSAAVAMDDPAYLMYTSGSTGKPKGALIPHRGIVRLVKNNSYIRFDRSETFLLSAPISFDASTLEIFGPLLNGGKAGLIEDPTPGLKEIGDAIRQYQVTTLWLTSALFSLMVDERPDDLRGVRQLLAGGDVLSKRHVARALDILGKDGKLVNGYGPTENTTFTTCHTIGAEDLNRGSIPIGRPINHTSCYIVDESMQLVPPGVTGRLYTGGDGLALGYWNRPELTGDKFVPNPFSNDPAAKLYDTGDECRWLEDGSIEFLGRADRQVKIRGFRIELGEVEKALSGHPSVGTAVVTITGSDSSNKLIVAYLVAEKGGKIDLASVREMAKKQLPNYMVPDHVVEIEELPVTPNGKLDYRALPEPVTAVAHSDGDSGQQLLPESDSEQRLARLWDEILGCGPVGIDVSFFDLGGHSLGGLKLFTRIHREFGVELPLATLFQAPTLRLLSRRIDRVAERKTGPEILTKIATGEPAETPLFLVHGGDGGTLFYRDFAERIKGAGNIYTIESPMLLDRSLDGPAESIEATASEYIRQILELVPSGPVALGGYSFGGVVAYEMARQLYEAGKQVEWLYLFDTNNPVNEEQYWNDNARWLREEWALLEGPDLLSKLAQAGGQFYSKLQFKVSLVYAKLASQGLRLMHRDLPDELRMDWINKQHDILMRDYLPMPYPGQTCLFSAKSTRFAFDREMGWTKLIENLEVREIPGNHRQIFSMPYVESLICRFNELHE